MARDLEVGAVLYRVAFTETDQESVDAQVVAATVTDIDRERGYLTLDDERTGPHTRIAARRLGPYHATPGEAIKQALGAAHQRRHTAVRALDNAERMVTAVADLLVSRMEAAR